MPTIYYCKNVHGNVDVILYRMQDHLDYITFFEVLDVWGSKGYDRFNDGGRYFEIPACMFDVIPQLPFVCNGKVKATQATI